MKVSTATLRPLCEAGHLVPAIDFVASLIFSTSSWFWTRILVPTHNRPYPGTTVALPDGGEAEVLLGSEEFTHTATGKSYAVRWIQNEAGELIVNDVELKN